MTAPLRNFRPPRAGEFLGIPPTGKSFTIAGIDIYRLPDGKMAEHWHVVDQFALLLQLGLLPAPGEPPAQPAARV